MPDIESIAPEAEMLSEVRGNLVLAALCVGQFRAPCQIESDHLLVRADQALAQTLLALGLSVRPVRAPFTPAPIFAPDQSVTGLEARIAAARRQVRIHISRDPDDDPEDAAPDAPASNA